MPVKIYRSTDNSAPVLSGQAGALINVLDACLVNGYATASVTSLTESGVNITAVLPVANGTLRVGDTVTIAGASPAGANGQVVITAILSSTSFRYTGPGGLGAITGTITYSKTSAGWTKPFSGTNLAVYRQPAGSNQRFVRFDDTGTTFARFVGYESMTDVNTGSEAFPTAVQQAGGLFAGKSNTADATVRPWVLFTNEKLFYLLINSLSGVASSTGGYTVFGDFTSYKVGDTFNTIAIGAMSASYTGLVQSFASHSQSVQYGNMVGHYMARAHTGIAGSIGFGKVINGGLAGMDLNGSYSQSSQIKPIGGNVSMLGTPIAATITMIYPSPVDGGLYMGKLWIAEGGNAIRGEMPGMWAPFHNFPLEHQVQFAGAGQFAGKTFEAYYTNNSYPGEIFFEISNTW